MFLHSKVDDIKPEKPAYKNVMYEMNVYCMNYIEEAFLRNSGTIK